MFKTKKDFVFVILAGIFIINAVTAELIGGKLIQIGPFVMSIGILPRPSVFLTTDLINEYFEKKGVKKTVHNHSWFNCLFFPCFTFCDQHSRRKRNKPGNWRTVFCNFWTKHVDHRWKHHRILGFSIDRCNCFLVFQKPCRK